MVCVPLWEDNIMEALLIFNAVLALTTIETYFKTGNDIFVPLAGLQTAMLAIGSLHFFLT